MADPTRIYIESVRGIGWILMVVLLLSITTLVMITYNIMAVRRWTFLWRFFGLLFDGISAFMLALIATNRFSRRTFFPMVFSVISGTSRGHDLLLKENEINPETDPRPIKSLSQFVQDENTFNFEPDGKIQKFILSGSYVNTPRNRYVQAVIQDIDDAQSVCTIEELEDKINARGESAKTTLEDMAIAAFALAFFAGFMMQMVTYIPALLR